MKDSKVRILWRKFKEDRTIEAETAWLAEHYRLGEVSKRNLEFCAMIGHKPSQKITGVASNACWYRNIEVWGPDAFFATMIYYAREAFDAIRDCNPAHDYNREWVFDFLQRVEAWFDAPSPTSYDAVCEFSDEVHDENLEGYDHRTPRGRMASIEYRLYNLVDQCQGHVYLVQDARALIEFSAWEKGIEDKHEVQILARERVQFKLIQRTLGYEPVFPL